MNLLVLILFFSLVGGAFSLIGGVALLKRQKWVQKHSCGLVAFAAGVLLTASFLGLLPEALEIALERNNDIHQLLLWPFGAMVLFFFLERSLIWWHHHHEPKIKAPANVLILIGDSVHNFIDGIVITTSFLVSIPLGIITSLAVAAHEIPQEMADFGIFLKNGVKPKKVLLINLGSALMSTLGALLAYLATDLIIPLEPQLLAFTAGMFIYISASDLIPELHHKGAKKSAKKQSLMFLVGILVMMILMNWSHSLK